jgi:hypothetical protein
VLSTAGAVAANVWQHVVVTRTAATKTVRFYVNGVAKGSGSYATTPSTGTSAVSIGRSGSGTGIQYAYGRLDEIAVYPVVLSADRIANHFALRTADGTGTPIALQLVGSDPDGDSLTYTATGLPASLSLSPTTGLISGMLSSANVGSYQVTVTASDGRVSISQTFTWTVLATP